MKRKCMKRKLLVPLFVFGVIMITLLSVFQLSTYAGKSGDIPANAILPVRPASCTIVDESKIGTKMPKKSNSDITPEWIEGELIYARTTYDFRYYTISERAIGPRYNDRLITSVATGATESVQWSTSLSGTITYSANVGFEIEKIINVGITGSASATLSGTWSTNRTYSGPPEGSGYRSRMYYFAMNYNRVDSVIKCTDWFDEYNYNNGKIILVRKNADYKVYDKTISNTKVPYGYSYSYDVN
jgi:hypothetical protein